MQATDTKQEDELQEYNEGAQEQKKRRRARFIKKAAILIGVLVALRFLESA